jgi:DNA-binding response OmpR family regulator
LELKDKNILIVDDDEIILETMSRILKDEGYRVDTAKSGKEALKKCKSKLFHLSILDIKLPDMEGIDLLRELSSKIKNPVQSKMIKIMITGFSSEKYAIRSLNLGADAYLLKPLNPEDILKIVGEKLSLVVEKEKKHKLKSLKEKHQKEIFLKYYR